MSFSFALTMIIDGRTNKRFAVVNAVEKCYICNFPLLTRQFYIFPCQHAFHADCLINQVKYLLVLRHRQKKKTDPDCLIDYKVLADKANQTTGRLARTVIQRTKPSTT